MYFKFSQGCIWCSFGAASTAALIFDSNAKLTEWAIIWINLRKKKQMFIFHLCFFQNCGNEWMYTNEWTNEYIRRINVKMNSSFFCKEHNFKSRNKTTITMNGTTANQSNCTFRKRVIISLSNKRVHTKVIDFVIILVLPNFQGYKEGGGSLIWWVANMAGRGCIRDNDQLAVNLRFSRFILLVQTKKWYPRAMAAAQVAAKPLYSFV